MDDCANDRQAGHTREVGYGAMHLDVHLIQCLLHPQYAASPLNHKIGRLAVERSEPGNRFNRTKRPTQQAATVQQLKPLTIGVVGLAPRHVVNLPCVCQHDLNTSRFQQLQNRNPIDRCALHRDRLGSLTAKPVRHSVQFVGGRSKDLDIGLSIMARWSTHPMLSAPRIDPCYFGTDCPQLRRCDLWLPLAFPFRTRHILTSGGVARPEVALMKTLPWGSVRALYS